MSNTLYIGNRNYSSWSLRPWLVLKWAGIPFVEREIRLDQPGYGGGGIAEVLQVSPTGRVPSLHAGNIVIWDSLAIAEWAAEEKPDAQLWPGDRAQRARARSVVAEMHAGFSDVRRQLTMNIRPRRPGATRCSPMLRSVSGRPPRSRTAGTSRVIRSSTGCIRDSVWCAASDAIDGRARWRWPLGSTGVALARSRLADSLAILRVRSRARAQTFVTGSFPKLSRWH